MGYGIFGKKITGIRDIKTPPNGASTMSLYENFNLAEQYLKKFALIALYEVRKEMGSHFRGNIKEVQDLKAPVPKRPLILVSPGWSLTITKVGRA